MNVQNNQKVSYPDNPPAGYRFLLEGETIRKGDQVIYLDRADWVLGGERTHCVGNRVGTHTNDLTDYPWVRPLFTPPAGYRRLEWNEKIEENDRFWCGGSIDPSLNSHGAFYDGQTPAAWLKHDHPWGWVRQVQVEAPKPADEPFGPSRVILPVGYRWLRPSEKIEPTDFWFSIEILVGGRPIFTNLVYRAFLGPDINLPADEIYGGYARRIEGAAVAPGTPVARLRGAPEIAKPVEPPAPKPRIDRTKITIPRGYRELTAGETIQAFDQYLHGKTWKAREGTKRVGHAYRPDECSVTIRATVHRTIDAAASEPGYRFLNLGERLAQGDECFYTAWDTTGGWLKGRSVGDDGYSCIYRRKIEVLAPAAPQPQAPKPSIVTRKLPSGRTLEVVIDRPSRRIALRVVTPNRIYVFDKSFTKAGAEHVRDALNEALSLF